MPLSRLWSLYNWARIEKTKRQMTMKELLSYLRDEIRKQVLAASGDGENYPLSASGSFLGHPGTITVAWDGLPQSMHYPPVYVPWNKKSTAADRRGLQAAPPRESHAPAWSRGGVHCGD